MVFKDGAGSATWSGFRWGATGLTAAAGAVNIAPASGERFPALGVPLYFAISNNGGTNTDVQVQVSDFADFSNIISAPSQANRPNGVMTLMPTALVAGTTYYWRVRGAPTGTTSWGPWSPAWTFTIDLNTGKACEYSMENIGIDPVLYSGTVDAIMENVGVQITLYAGVLEESYQNIGVQITLSPHATEYVYENANDLTPVPHVWFAYKKYGFVNDQILIYGQGFGALQTQYNAQPKLDWGPDFTLADIALGAQSWVNQPSMADSFGPDRRIHAGGDDYDPPFSNVETDIFTIVVPNAALPTAEQGAQADFLYVVTTGGTSNKVGFLLFPTIPVPMSIPIISMRTGGVLIVVADPVGVADMAGDIGIDQPSMTITAVPYIVVGGIPQRDPMLGAVSITSAKLGV